MEISRRKPSWNNLHGCGQCGYWHSAHACTVVTSTTYNNQKRATVVSFMIQLSIWVREVVNWCCHAVLRGLFSDPCFLVSGCAWIRSVSGCLPLKLVRWQLWYSKKEQLSKGLDHPTLVVISLSESTWARTCQSIEGKMAPWVHMRQKFLPRVAYHAPGTIHYLSESVTPPKICGENFRGTAQICEIRESFLPRKFPAIRYICEKFWWILIWWLLIQTAKSNKSNSLPNFLAIRYLYWKKNGIISAM